MIKDFNTDEHSKNILERKIRMFCRNCGKEITEESLFCPFCGDLLKCPSCNNLVDMNDECCKKCGKELYPIKKSITAIISTKNDLENGKLDSNNLQVKSKKNIMERKKNIYYCNYNTISSIMYYNYYGI